MIDLTNELQTSAALWRDDIASDAVVRLQVRLGDAEGYIVRDVARLELQFTGSLFSAVQHDVERTCRQSDQAMVAGGAVLREPDEVASVLLLFYGFDIRVVFACIPRNPVEQFVISRQYNGFRVSCCHIVKIESCGCSAVADIDPIRIHGGGVGFHVSDPRREQSLGRRKRIRYIDPQRGFCNKALRVVENTGKFAVMRVPVFVLKAEFIDALEPQPERPFMRRKVVKNPFRAVCAEMLQRFGNILCRMGANDHALSVRQLRNSDRCPVQAEWGQYRRIPDQHEILKRRDPVPDKIGRTIYRVVLGL